MPSNFGDIVKFSFFGESHGKYIGVVIDNLPAGEKLDLDEIQMFMSRRAPGKDSTTTPRKEMDIPEIVSGFKDGYTTGAPLCALIENQNIRSKDYSLFDRIPRPGHADYTAHVKYSGFNDVRGGGHFSGRLTAPLVFAGSVCRQILKKSGVQIASHISSVGNIQDAPFDSTGISVDLIDRLNHSAFAVLDDSVEEKMRKIIDEVKKSEDSIGGTIECIITGIRCGLGAPLFGGIEGIISSAVFAVPAVKGIEFGSGFRGTHLKGSQNNDVFYFDEHKEVKTKTNNCGGILGGISTGMPIIFKVAIKPTPSISKEQNSVDLLTKETTKLKIKGRHDPCIVSRATPVIESACAIALAQLCLN